MYHRIGKGGKRYWGKRGAGIVFTDGQKLLLIRRAGDGGAADHVGKWCMPGGKTEEGETPLETARRECREEIGTVQGTRWAQFDERDGKFTFIVFMYKVDKPFDVKLSEEHDDYKWVPINDIGELELHPEFKRHLPYYLRAIRQKFSDTFSEWLTSRTAQDLL